jgi:AbrB family looped-hinge helix DNA binding protein
MSFTVSITSQWQISLPAKIRNQLGFSRLGKALVSVQDGKIIVEPVKDLLDLGGSFSSTKKPLSNKEIHTFFAQSIVDDYRK